VFYPELKGPALEAYKAMVSQLKTKAMRELRLPEDQIVIRDLRPEDYGASSADGYAGIAAASWTAIVDDATIADNRFIGICGFFQGSTIAAEPRPPIVQIRITRKGSKTRYWNVQDIGNWKHKTGWCDDPITVDQNTTITIDAWGRTASSITNFGFIGAVAEKKGVLVSPTERW